MAELPLHIRRSSSHCIFDSVLFIASNLVVSPTRSLRWVRGSSVRRSLGVLLAIRRPPRQPKRPNQHLEQLERVFPSTIFINWYNQDLEEHPERRHLDLDDQVWYVTQNWKFQRRASSLTNMKCRLSRCNQGIALRPTLDLPTLLSHTVP
jgi:hypothetical protein